MKRSAYARRVGVNDKTARRRWRAGKLDASQVATGMVMVREPAEPAIPSPANHHVAISARVSAAEKRPHLESQAERLITYCSDKGSQAHQVVNEIGSGVTESRPTRLKMLAEPALRADDLRLSSSWWWSTKSARRAWGSAFSNRCWNNKSNTSRPSPWPSRGARS